ncbi:MAG: hypothetical protein CM1200mP26_23660 [Acidimicrobiales bacterium]|nr:MAG: hypothetical protein CM1200mP26_23660 [Acidimicrobiales bacterium]
MTNFHLPRSTLLVMLEAFSGQRWRAWYADALSCGYRFLSFGDAMLAAREEGKGGGAMRAEFPLRRSREERDWNRSLGRWHFPHSVLHARGYAWSSPGTFRRSI